MYVLLSWGTGLFLENATLFRLKPIIITTTIIVLMKIINQEVLNQIHKKIIITIIIIIKCIITWIKKDFYQLISKPNREWEIEKRKNGFSMTHKFFFVCFCFSACSSICSSKYLKYKVYSIHWNINKSLNRNLFNANHNEWEVLLFLNFIILLWYIDSWWK